MSRCLRSPVDAGSIEYSAVTQPRPDPNSQRGTPSCADAVQITRVSPIEISADPVAVRTNPGSILARRSCPGAPPELLGDAALIRGSARHPGWPERVLGSAVRLRPAP